MLKKKKAGLKLALLMMPLAVSSHAIAQQAVQSETTEVSEDETKFENTILVTAQRREQNLQDVPLAVTALSSKQMEEMQIFQTIDIVPYIPNAVAQHNTGPGTANAYFIRGLGSADTAATFDPPVGTYVDDLFVARQSANNFAFFDVDRVEVLRGPQGTLFGRNTTGGAVRVLLRKPVDEFGGVVSAGYGRFDRYEVKGTVDVPVSDSFLTKFSAYYIEDSGFVTNRFLNEDGINAEENWGIRGAARVLAGDLTWDISADYIDNSRANNLNFKDGDDRFTVTGLPKAGGTLVDFGGQPLLTGEKNDSPTGSTAETFSILSKFTYDISDRDQLEFITGFLDTKDDLLVDIFAGGIGTLGDDIPGSQITLPEGVRGSFNFSTGGFTFGQFAEHRQITQEVKLNGDRNGGKFKYVLGAYYFNEKNETDLGQIFSITPSGFPLVLVDSKFDNDTQSTAVYGQIDYEIIDNLNLTLGLRYTDETKDISFFDNQPAGNATDITDANVTALGIPLEQNSKILTPRIAAAYEISDDMNVFVSATRGFKSGGWNAAGTNAAQLVPFGPEKVWSYEAGLRAQWLDSRLTTNVTAFKTDIEDFQVLTAIPNGTGFANVTRNFADLEVSGLELETNVNVNSYLSLFANLGIQDTNYVVDEGAPATDQFGILSVAEQQRQCLAGTSAACSRGIVTADGAIADPTRTPEFSGSAGYRVSIPVSGLNGEIKQSTSAQFFTDHPRSTSNSPISFTGDRTLVNAALSFESDAGWTASLGCQNCFDETYTISNVAVFAFINDPMRWSLSLTMPFGARAN